MRLDKLHIDAMTRNWISKVTCRGLLFYVQWFEVWGNCYFCWYWWNCWPSLFKLFFHDKL